MTIYVFTIVAVALLFDFYNGMNDAANSIATVVATRVLSPRVAVLWAAFFNFIAAFGFALSTVFVLRCGEARFCALAPVALAIGALLDEALEGVGAGDAAGAGTGSLEPLLPVLPRGEGEAATGARRAILEPIRPCLEAAVVIPGHVFW